MPLHDIITHGRGHKENEDWSNLKNLPPTSLCHMLQSSWCPLRARHLIALITNYPTNQSLLAMEQLSALHSIGGEWTSNPCSSLFLSLSPEITTNALHTLTVVCKTEREKSICFPLTELRSHYMPCQVQNLKLHGWIFTSCCCKAGILVITSIYFSVICVG